MMMKDEENQPMMNKEEVDMNAEADN